MFKGRRVGTLTAGVILLVFGGLFLLRLFWPAAEYRLVFSFWPLILLLLGVEILVSYFVNRPAVMRYDFGSIVLCILLSLFAMGMACADFVFTHLHILLR